MLSDHGEMKEDEPGKAQMQSAALCQLFSWENWFCSPFPGEMAREGVHAFTTIQSPQKCLSEHEQETTRTQTQLQLHPGLRKDAGRCQLCPRAQGITYIRASWGCAGTVTCWCWNISPLPPVSCRQMEEAHLRLWRCLLPLKAFSRSLSNHACLCCPFQCLDSFQASPFTNLLMLWASKAPSCPWASLLNYIKGQ